MAVMPTLHTPTACTSGCVAAEGFGDQPGRVGEVEQQGIRGGLLDVFGDVQDDRDGAQGLGHAAHAGGFLADEAVALAEVLVIAAGLHLPHAQLGDDIVCAADGLALVCC